jgi:hypothetical protein
MNTLNMADIEHHLNATARRISRQDDRFAALFAGAQLAQFLICLRHAVPVRETRNVQAMIDRFCDAAGIEQVEDDMGCLTWRLADPALNDVSVEG